MKKANWLIMFLLGLVVAVPASAVELNLGGFPSYMSTRARYIENATSRAASAVDATSEDSNIFFVDTTLRVTPQLVLSDAVTIRAQIDILDNNIWGGRTDGLLGGGSSIVNSSVSPSDKFRGTILHGNTNTDCLDFGNFCAVEDDAGFFNVRMLHVDIVLPDNLGFVRIGRQPFDWGLGILANGGWDPNSDGGFIVDRFLWLKSFSIAPDVTVTPIFVSDRITQGTGLHTGGGDGWDGGAAAVIANHANVMDSGINATLGAYVFPYIHQDEFIGGFGDLDRFTLYSFMFDLKASDWKFAGELQGGFGKITGISDAFDINGERDDSDISNAIIFALRAEYLAPTIEYINMVGAEFGWAPGDENSGDWKGGEDIEGGVIVFNPAYNLDNLLFKHVMPSIYQDAHGNTIARADASVQNAYYARIYTSIPVSERVTFSPQILVGWNNETDNLIRDVQVGTVADTVPTVTGATLGPDSNGTFVNGTKDVWVGSEADEDVDSYLGTEVEGKVTVNVYPGVNLDIIGSVIFAGDGLTGLLEGQAFARDNANDDTTAHADATAAETAIGTLTTGQKADDLIWGVQTKLTVYIDEFFKSDDV